MKLLAIAGSPRAGGNTELLLERAVKGAVRGDAEVRTVFLRELNIEPCRHCDGCLKTGKCVIPDDMQWIHEELRGLDRLILASPIFFMGVTAQTKAMIDRCQALWVLKYQLKLPLPTNEGRKRRGLFISVGALRRANLFEPAKTTVSAFFNTLDIKYAAELLLPSVDEKGAIANNSTALQEAFLLGKSLMGAKGGSKEKI